MPKRSSNPTHADWALVLALGGPQKLAAQLGFVEQRVWNWKRRGIPSLVKLDHPQLFLRKPSRRATRAAA